MSQTLEAQGIWVDRLTAAVTGRATSDEIARWVDGARRDGRTVARIPLEALARLPAAGRVVGRYGHSGGLACEVAFQHPHGPGGVVVRTPPMAATPGRPSYCVEPHAHDRAHVTVVLEGEADFFALEPVDGRPTVVSTRVRPGTVLLCPAGVAHTFGTRGGAFTVLSIQARFTDPSEAEFAEDVDDFEGRPVLSREV